MARSTECIWGLKATRSRSSKDYVDWAIGLLESGLDSKNLRILAGMDPKGTLFEAEDYFEKTTRDLGLVEPLKEEAIRLYSIYVANQIIECKLDAHKGVHILYRLSVEADYPQYLRIWSGLDDACLSGEEGQYPYPGLTRDNLEETVIREAKSFIAEQRPQSS